MTALPRLLSPSSAARSIRLRMRRVLLGFCLLAATLATPARAWEPVKQHPQNPYLIEFRGQPTLLLTFAEHYSAVINSQFQYIPYLDSLQQEGMNLTRVILLGFHSGTDPTVDALAPTPGTFLQPWPRNSSQGGALDGWGKWDFSKWNASYFNRLRSFVQAASDRGIVVEITFFSTLYTPDIWNRSPFNRANNLQGYGPTSRHDAMRPVNAGLFAAQTNAVRKIVRELNQFDNIFYEIQNEPFWNEANVKDAQEVYFHNSMLTAIRDEESTLPNRHSVAHNYPEQVGAISTDFDIINTHYPFAVPATPILGGENLLNTQYNQGRVLSMGETGGSNATAARLESWMFILGGGGIYNGLDASFQIYSLAHEAGNVEPGISIRATLRNLATYAGGLDLLGLRRDLSWIGYGAPASARTQGMSNPGQQYVAYFYHGQFSAPYQTSFYPIDGSNHTMNLRVNLPAGSWRAVWTRPSDLTTIKTEDFTHGGGTHTLESLVYQADVALRIDRAGAGDTTPPPVPQNLAATPASTGRIDLAWSAVQASDLAAYHVYRSTTTGVPVDPAYRIAVIPAGQNTHSDLPAEPNELQHYVVTAVDQDGNESAASLEATALSQVSSEPFGGTARAIPGTVQCEDFDNGGDAIAYHDLSPGNAGGQYRTDVDVDIATTADQGGGHHLTGIQTGEWLTYSINVAQTDEYNLDLRCAIPAAGTQIRISIDNTVVADAVTVPSTGGAWQTLTLTDFDLTAGSHRLRIDILATPPSGTAGSFNWFSLTEKPWTGPVADAGADQTLSDDDLDIFASVTLDGRATTAGLTPVVSYSWVEDDEIIASGANPTLDLPVGSHTIELVATDSAGLAGTDEVTIEITADGFINGSFEVRHAGWTTNGNVFWTDYYGAQDGAILTIFNAGNTAPGGWIEQSFPTIPGQTYEITFDLGVIAFTNAEQRVLFEITGASPLVSETYSLTGQGTSGSGVQTWVVRGESFVADSDHTTVRFTDVSPTSRSLDVAIDNVQLTGGPVTHLLSIQSSPFTGVPVAATPADLLGNTDGTTSFNRRFADQATVTLTAPATHDGAPFVKWQLDGADFSVSESATVTLSANATMTAVYAANAAPVANADSHSTGMDSTLTVPPAGVLANDTDAESQPLTAVLDSDATHGTLALNSDGGFTYTPDGGYIGDDSFTYHANDGFLDSPPATVNLTVSPLAPSVLVNGSFEQDATGWNITGNHFIIPESGAYTATDGTKLVVSNGGQLPPNSVYSQSFATVPGQTYTLTFDMGVIGGIGKIQSLGINVSGAATLLSATESITGVGTSLSKWAYKSFAFIADDTTATLTFSDISATGDLVDLLLDNVNVWPPAPRFLTVTSTPPSGITIGVTPADLAGDGPAATPFTRSYEEGIPVTLTAPTGDAALVFEKWTLDGVDFGTDPDTTVTMDISHNLVAVFSAVNQAPAASPDSYSTGVGLALEVPAAGVLTNDSDPEADPLTAILDDSPDHGSLALNSDGSFTYTPDPGYDGPDSFTYHANDGELDSPPVSVDIDILAIVPTGLVNGSFEDDENGWTITGNRIVIETTPPYFPTDERKFMVFNGAQSTPSAVISQSFSTVPGQNYVLEFDMGVFGPTTSQQRLNIALTGNSSLVSVTQAQNGPGNGTVNWQPRAWPFVADSSTTTLTLSDSSTVTSNVDLLLDRVRVTTPGTRTLRIDHADGAPLAIAITPGDHAGENDGYAAVHRYFGDGALVAVSAPPSHEGGNFLKWQKNGADFGSDPATTITMDGDHALTAFYSDAPQLLVNGSFEDDYTGWNQTGNQLVSPDAQASHGLKVVELNGGQQTPDAALSQTFPTIAGKNYQLNFDFGIISAGTDQQSLSVAIQGTSVLLAESVSANGPGGGNTIWFPQMFNFTADGDTATLTFTDTSAATYNIDALLDHVRVTGLTSQRLLTVDATTATGVPVTVSPPDLNAEDDGSTLLVRNFANQATANLTAPAQHDGALFIKWQLDGADLGTDPAVSVTMDADHTLTAVYIENEAPAANPDNHTTTAGVLLEIPAPGLLANDSDADGDPLTATAVGGPAHGTLNLLPDGGFTYMPDPGYDGPDSFTYQAHDGIEPSAPATVGLTVEPVVTGSFVNAGFENGNTGWILSGHVAVGSTYPGTEGSSLVVFNGSDSTPGGSISQTFPTHPGAVYHVAFDLGILAYTADSQTLLVEVNGDSTLHSHTDTLVGTADGEFQWASRCFSFTADGTDATLAFTDQSAATTGIDLLLDNLRIRELPNGGILPPPALNNTETGWSITLPAPEPGLYQLQRSSDLSNWETIRETTLAEPGALEFTDEPAPAAPVYYRIALDRCPD